MVYLINSLVCNPCPKCNAPMIRRIHTKIPKRPSYFSEWDYCPKCSNMQSYPEYLTPSSEFKPNEFTVISEEEGQEDQQQLF